MIEGAFKMSYKHLVRAFCQFFFSIVFFSCGWCGNSYGILAPSTVPFNSTNEFSVNDVFSVAIWAVFFCFLVLGDGTQTRGSLTWGFYAHNISAAFKISMLSLSFAPCLSCFPTNHSLLPHAQSQSRIVLRTFRIVIPPRDLPECPILKRLFSCQRLQFPQLSVVTYVPGNCPRDRQKISFRWEFFC